MKEVKFFGITIGYFILLVSIYVFAVPRIEQSISKLWYVYVTRTIANDKKVLHSNDHFLLGMYRPELPYHYDFFFTVQESLGVTMRIVSFYQAWGDGEEHEFKDDIMRNIARGGMIPLVTWEPWVTAFKQYEGQNPDSSLALIADGEFDYYIRSWAKASVRFGKPFFLRPGHEMSNPWYAWSSAHGNSPELFIHAWRHIYDIFREEGARNVAFVWNPYKPEDTKFYPGDEYVDWVGLDIFNFGHLAEQGVWLDFYTITKLFYDAVSDYKKPILIAEVGCAPSGGNKANWFRDMFHSLAVGNFPLIKALTIFDNPTGTTPGGMKVDLSMTGSEGIYNKINREELIEKCNNSHRN